MLIQLRDPAGGRYELAREDRTVVLAWPGQRLELPFLMDMDPAAEAAERMTWLLHSRALARMWLGLAADARPPGPAGLLSDTDLSIMAGKCLATLPPEPGRRASQPDGYVVLAGQGEVEVVRLRGRIDAVNLPALALLAMDGAGGAEAFWPVSPRLMRPEPPFEELGFAGRRAAAVRAAYLKWDAKCKLADL